MNRYDDTILFMRKEEIMKKRCTLILMLAVALIATSVVAQNRNGKRTDRPERPLKKTNCYEQAGVTQETLDAMDAIRKLAVEQLKIAETREEGRVIIEQLRADIQTLFTEDQLAAIQECMRPEKPATCMDQIGLTAEQIEAIDGIRESAMAAIKEAEGPKEARDVIEQMHQAVEDVLTETQLADLRACQRPDKPADCINKIGLNENQIAEIDLIRKAAMEAAKLATTREEVRAIMDKMAEDTMAILTDEQVTALQECRDAKSDRPDYGGN